MEDLVHPLIDEVFSYRRINSTSTQAIKLIREHAVAGHFLVIADSQTNGHGRSGSSWYSPNGGIWMTLAFFGLPESSLITLLIGNCIHQAILDSFPELSDDLKLKWPNDILYGDKKVAGILTEHFPIFQYTIIGIGIDTNIQDIPPDLETTISSLSSITHREINDHSLILGILDRIEEKLPLFYELDYKDLLSYHNMFSYLNGKQVDIHTDFGTYHGSALEVNSEGAIVLDIGRGLKQPFFSGSVNLSVVQE